MKKFLAIIAVAGFLTACNDGDKTSSTTDTTTNVKVDTTVKVTVDTNHMGTTVDTTTHMMSTDTTHK